MNDLSFFARYLLQKNNRFRLSTKQLQEMGNHTERACIEGIIIHQ
jgi:hypothetical protein